MKNREQRPRGNLRLVFGITALVYWGQVLFMGYCLAHHIPIQIQNLYWDLFALPNHAVTSILRKSCFCDMHFCLYANLITVEHFCWPKMIMYLMSHAYTLQIFGKKWSKTNKTQNYKICQKTLSNIISKWHAV